ncbi:MAG: inositol-3-phosphate synthase [Acidobacteriota bacterium]
MGKIRVAIAGVGNCASSLIQGIEWYRAKSGNFNGDVPGLMNESVGGYRPHDIEFVAAFDVDARKVGKPLEEAIFALPNNTMDLCTDIPPTGVTVQMGPVHDGVAAHMSEYPDEQTFVVADAEPVDVEAVLRESGAEILLNYLPVGSEMGVRFYAECALNTGVSLINCMPVFIVSDPSWAARFEAAGIPVIGDDIKAQVGATIMHRTLTRLLVDRGVKVDRTYQLNTGGNTDFLNMLSRDRLASKKISKTEAVQSQLPEPLPETDIHIGPSDYVPWQKDNKLCFLRVEGRGFGGFPFNVELRLSVEDSPNSGGCSVDAIRACKLARERGIGGPLEAVSAYLMKHPPVQIPDDEARRRVQLFIAGADSDKEVVAPVTVAAPAFS